MYFEIHVYSLVADEFGYLCLSVRHPDLFVNLLICFLFFGRSCITTSVEYYSASLLRSILLFLFLFCNVRVRILLRQFYWRHYNLRHLKYFEAARGEKYLCFL